VFQNQQIKNQELPLSNFFINVSIIYFTTVTKKSLGMLAGVNTQEQDHVGQAPL
jgi:hypothetical protein